VIGHERATLIVDYQLIYGKVTTFRIQLIQNADGLTVFSHSSHFKPPLSFTMSFLYVLSLWAFSISFLYGLSLWAFSMGFQYELSLWAFSMGFHYELLYELSQ